jgi:hypothetical protein
VEGIPNKGATVVNPTNWPIRADDGIWLGKRQIIFASRQSGSIVIIIAQ